MKATLLTLWLLPCLYVSAQTDTTQIKQKAAPDTTGKPGQLQEVKVQTSPPRLIEQQPGKTIVHPAALLSNTGVSALEVLNNAPGVEITESTLTLDNRSGVQLYIDGRQIQLDGRNLLDYIRTIPSGTIDKIELMTTPPARFHAGAGGVIHIITKKNKTPGFNGTVSTGLTLAGYYNTDDNLSLNRNTGKLNLYFNAGFRSNWIYYSVHQQRDYAGTGAQIRQINREADHSVSYNLRTGFDYTFNNRNSLSVQLEGITSPYHENGIYQQLFNHQTTDSALLTRSTHTRPAQNAGGTANYHHTFRNSNNQLHITADYLRYTDQARQQINSVTTESTGNSMLNNYTLNTASPFRASLYSSRADFEGATRYFKLAAGLQFNYAGRNNHAHYSDADGKAIDSMSSRQQAAEKTGATYITLSKDLRHFTWQAGLRYEYTHTASYQYSEEGLPVSQRKLNYSNLLPTLYLTWKMDTAGKQSLVLTFNTYVNRPDFGSLNPFVFYFDKYYTIKGNPLLKASRSTNLELSYIRSSHFTAGTRVNIESNSITTWFSSDYDTLASMTQNIGHHLTTGVFSTFSITPYNWLTINGYEEIYYQHFTGPLSSGAAYNNQLTTARLQLNTQYKLSHNYTAELSGNYVTRNTYGQGYTLPYGRLNSSLRKKLLKNKATLTFTATDILHTAVIRKNMALAEASFTRRLSYDSRRFTLTFQLNFGGTVKRQTLQSGLETERGRIQ